MKKIQVIFALFFILLSSGLSWAQQKKVIDYTAFDGWKTLKNEQVSPSGKYITYEIQPHKGDTKLFYYNTETDKLDSINRAKNASFSYDEKFLIYVIEAGYDTLRRVELDKVDKKKWPKDSLAVFSFETGKTIKMANVKSHLVGKKHAWLTYLENDNEIKEAKKAAATPVSKSKNKKAAEPVKPKAPKSDGKVLRLWNLEDGTKIAFKNVTSYQVSEDGRHLIYVQNQNDSSTINVLALKNFNNQVVPKVFRGVEHLVVDTLKKRMVFLGSPDTTKTKIFELFKYDFNDQKLSCLIDTSTTEIPKKWTVVKNVKPRFSPISDRLYFGVNEIPVPEKKDTLTDEEKPKFDLWHYDEPVLQTQQIAGVKREAYRAYTYAYDFVSGKVIALEDDTLSIQSNYYELEELVLGSSARPYEKEYMWDISGKEDYYTVNLQTGERKLIKRGVTKAADLSRKGDLFVYFNHENGNYYALNLHTQKEQCLTCAEKGKDFTEDRNGMPMELSSIGLYGWNKEGTQIYLAEKNDFYAYDFEKGALINLTQNIGAKNNIEFRARQWNRDSTFMTLDNFYLVGLDKATKGSHLYFFENGELIKKGYWDAKLVSVVKAKNASVFALRKQTVQEYPDVHFWKGNVVELKKISTANPQQSEYNWATVELIDWKSYKGLNLQGLVYKPENFDANKSYPLLVYFYEMYSDDLHNHYTPRPTASIIFPTEYASGDYIVFIPDIRYEPGYPARGAYDCIMSGTDAVLKKYPNIDSTRMGLQGQSWGGYQTAQLITMTTRYKAAMAGAPVGNMFSAFGGIRWGTGMSRQFQYEKTQSRIGKTIWEAPELYVENSPVFHLPKVKTPLLIMHNDADGAVPWYQGIEIFTGMRRLGKPCWLLNYNGDDHNLMKTANRRDLSIRMRQFFDYYLQGAPMPLWLKEGIPAVKKGIELRYELDQE